jgi:hypothetical protein
MRAVVAMPSGLGVGSPEGWSWPFCCRCRSVAGQRRQVSGARQAIAQRHITETQTPIAGRGPAPRAEQPARTVEAAVACGIVRQLARLGVSGMFPARSVAPDSSSANRGPRRGRPSRARGVVLDPFAGSGTTGVAALLEGRRFLGVEVGGEHTQIARDRIAATGSQINLADYRAGQKPLFSLDSAQTTGLDGNTADVRKRRAFTGAC